MQWLINSNPLNINFIVYLRPLRGASAVVIGAGPAHALYFSSYEFTKEGLAKMKINGNLSYGRLRFKDLL